MLSIEATSETSSSCSERRLAANRANAQLSTGPRTEQGKAISSLNAVKTGLCGHAVLLADEEQARAYREHIERVFAWWEPDNVEEHALVQALADTQWRLESIPGLESALYAQARLRGEPVLTHPDPVAQRLLLNAQAEVTEAKALKNLRLHERLQREARKREAEAHRQQQEAAQQRRQEQAQKRAERRKARETAAFEEIEPVSTPNGFEFATSSSANPGHSPEPTLLADLIA